LAALEDFAADDLARATLVKTVAEKVAHDLEVPLERSFLADQFGRFLIVCHPDIQSKKRRRVPKERAVANMAPKAGIEPATRRLTVACSTAELLRNNFGR